MTLFNLVLVGAVAMLALNISLEIATSFINFGAFLAFTAVNLCVIAYFIRNRRQGTTLSVTGFIVLPVLGAAVDIYLLTQLSPIAITIGCCWLGLGVLYLVFLTKGFRKEPPEMRLHDRDGQPDEPNNVQHPNGDQARSTKQTEVHAQPTEI